MKLRESKLSDGRIESYRLVRERAQSLGENKRLTEVEADRIGKK